MQGRLLRLIHLPMIVLAILLVLMGLFVDFGWLIGSKPIAQIRPNFAPMQFNTALCFWLFGLAFLSQNRLPKLSFFLNGVVFLIATLTLIQYIFNVNFHIDELVVKDFVMTKTTHPGRMAPNTAIGFFFSAVALFFLYLAQYRRLCFYLSVVMLAIIWIVALLSLFSYVTGIEEGYGWNQWTRMALHTTTSFLIIGLFLFLYSFYFVLTQKYSMTRFFSLVISFSVFSASLVLAQGVETYEKNQIIRILAVESKGVSDDIRKHLQWHIDALNRLAGHWQSHGEISEAAWRKDASQLEKYFNGFSSVGYLAKEKAINWGEPDPILMNQYFFSHLEKKDLEKKIAISDIKYKNEQPHLLISIPVNMPKGFVGNMLGLMDVDRFIDGFLRKESRRLFFLSVYENKKLAYSTNQDLIKSKKTILSTSLIHFYNTDWVVKVYPTVSLLQEVKTGLFWVVILGGVVLAFLMFYLIELIGRIREVGERIKLKNEELNQFAYTASHDLKSPLRAIVSLIGFIREDLGESLEGDSKRHFETIESRAVRMQKLLDGILAYSRAGSFSEDVQWVDVDVLLKDIINNLYVPEGVHIEVTDTMPMIRTSYVALYQVFSNLITNAVKYQKEKVGEIKIGVKNLKTYYEFSVSDTGVGIAPEHQKKIFQIFQTLHNKDEYESTGVGLAIVDKIVKAQGGRVRVESTVGEGSTFYFTWPRELRR